MILAFEFYYYPLRLWGSCLASDHRSSGGVNLWGCGVVGLYGSAFERDPYECSILIKLWFRKMSILTGINHTTYTTAPIFQEGSLKQYVSNCRVLGIRMMRSLDGLNGQFVWQMARILNLYPIIIDGDAYGTACTMEHPVTKGICQCLTQCFSRNLQFLFSRKAHDFATEGKVELTGAWLGAGISQWAEGDATRQQNVRAIPIDR